MPLPDDFAGLAGAADDEPDEPDAGVAAVEDVLELAASEDVVVDRLSLR